MGILWEWLFSPHGNPGNIIKLIAGLIKVIQTVHVICRTNKRHGNFLKMVLLVSKYDLLLSANVAQYSERGEKQIKGEGAPYLPEQNNCEQY